ncbi:MAG: substrate-binding periplasmic protein [Eubacteriaceae bacterium]
MKKKLAALAALLLCSVLILTGCGSSSDSTDSSDPLADGTLTIAVDDTYLPMEYRDDNNNLVGFDIDFGEALAEELGVKADFKTVAWDGIFTGLTSNQYDIIISSTSITPERQQNYSQSDAYISNGIVIVGRADYDSPVTTFEGLSGKTVGVQLETSADIAAQKLKEQYGTDVTIKQFDGMLDAFSALEGKQIDYVMTDMGVAQYYVTQKPDVFVITTPTPLTNEPIGTTARKDEAELTTKINEAIKKLKENGKMAEISNKWFGKDMTSDIDTTLNVIE